jgi:ectoine hydroxylase-related dioxygenase (phytanoyl-CoA dioxygenase family)
MDGAALSEEQIEEYERDGLLILRRAVSERTLDAVRACFARVVDEFAAELVESGELASELADLDFEHRWAAVRAEVPASRPIVWRRAIIDPAVHRLWFEPGLVGAARSLLGPRLRAYDLFNGRPREPHDPGQTINWHQDAFNSPEWNERDGRILTFWIPLVPVDEPSGCLAVQPGSHRGGLREKTTDEFGVTRTNIEVGDPGVSVPLEPGDALMFNELVLHRSLDNVSDRVRWSADIRISADTAEHRRKSPGGFRITESADGPPETFTQWAAKWDPKTGVMRRQLRRLDIYARTLGKDGRDVRSY